MKDGLQTDNDRFILIHENDLDQNSGHPFVNAGFARIIVDTVTGVQYLSNKVGSGNGLTVLVDQNGKPLLYEPQNP